MNARRVKLPYRNRLRAGRELARHLEFYRDHPNLLVLALPRGGVPVAAEVARALHADLDVLMVRKLGLPSRPELTMGAIANGGVCVRDDPVLRAAHVPEGVLEHVVECQRRELHLRQRIYRGRRPLPAVQGRTVIVVQDGVATGSTMRAALAALSKKRPAEIVVAVPVGAAEPIAALEQLADKVVCPASPEPFGAVGAYYDNFVPVTDEEVAGLLTEGSNLKKPEPVDGAR